MFRCCYIEEKCKWLWVLKDYYDDIALNKARIFRILKVLFCHVTTSMLIFFIYYQPVFKRNTYILD